MITKDKQEAIFDLIKSMTKAEKRNFKLYATRLATNESSKFLSLFDAIDSLEKYEESKILERCPIKKTQLANTKAHLQRQILVSLRLLNVQHSLTLQLREQMDFARILYNKGLYRQSLKILDKCYDKAVKNHQHPLTLEIIYFMRQIESMSVSSIGNSRSTELSKQATLRCKIISRINELSSMEIQLFDLHHSLGYARTQEDLDMIDRFFAPKLKSYDTKNWSFLEKFYYHQAYAWFYYIKHNFVMSYRHAVKWVDLFNSAPQMKVQMYDNYLKGYARILDGLYMMRRYRQLCERIDSLEKECEILASENENAQIFSTRILLTAKINKCFIEGNFKQGLNLIDDNTIKELNRKNSLSSKIMLHYKVASLYFGNGDYIKCMYHLNKIPLNKDLNIRRDVQCYAKMLHLIASYQAGMDYNLDYQIRSVYSFLVKINDLQQVQKELLSFLKRLNKIYAKDFKAELQRLYENIKPYEHHPYLQRTFYYLDIISWLESMLSGETVSDIIQKKFRSLN